MHVCVDDLGDGFITFPEFQRQLRELEQSVSPTRVEQRTFVRPMYWIGHKGSGVRDDDGKPLLFSSIHEADRYIRTNELEDAAVYGLPTTDPACQVTERWEVGRDDDVEVKPLPVRNVIVRSNRRLDSDELKSSCSLLGGNISSRAVTIADLSPHEMEPIGMFKMGLTFKRGAKHA